MSRHIKAALFAAVVWGLAAPSWAGHLHPRLQQEAVNNGARGPIEQVIVTSDDSGGAAAAANAVQLQGLQVLQSLPSLNAVLTSAPAGQLPLLAASTGVTSVEPDEPVVALDDVVSGAVGANLVQSQSGLTGRGVTVAVLDSGIFLHPDLGRRVIGWDDLVNGRAAPYDDNGHGTHVAGIIAGDGRASSHPWNTQTFTGIAPEASLVGVKVLDGQGNGKVSTVVSGIDWCIRNRERYGIRIINLSLGHKPTDSYQFDPLCQACEKASQHGILVVTAAGNAGHLGLETIDSPGIDPMVLTVGSTDTMGTPAPSDDVISSYSGRGPTLFDHVLKPDLVAPGNQVVSLRAPGSYLDVNYPSLVVPLASYSSSASGDSQYFTLSGTSMAAAVASGGAALLLQADPDQSPGSVKARMMLSASKLASSSSDLFCCGAGYLNLPAALAWPQIGEEHGQHHAQALSPLISRDPTSSLFSIHNGDGPFWNNNLLWGDTALWGDLSANTALWGDLAAATALWGDLSANTAFWGDLSASTALWGDLGKPVPRSPGNVSDQTAFWGDGSANADTALWGDD